MFSEEEKKNCLIAFFPPARLQCLVIFIIKLGREALKKIFVLFLGKLFQKHLYTLYQQCLYKLKTHYISKMKKIIKIKKYILKLKEAARF